MKNKGQQETYPSCFKSVCDLFEEQARLTPESIAIVYEDTHLTYQELSQRSNGLAAYLKRLGVRSQTIIGFSVENSLNLLIGILGILKSGGIYLPLDPSYPDERLHNMLLDANPEMLLTNPKFDLRFAKYQGTIIKIDSLDQSSWDDQGTKSEPIDSKNLAYIVYTSGSTGKPKGIMVTHESLAHAALAHKNYYPGSLRALLLGAISFDVSILTIFHTLTFGGMVCVPSQDSVADVHQVKHLINKFSLNFLLCVPSFYSTILNNPDPLPSLKNVSLAGENIPSSLPPLHAKLAPSAILYNEYGPSEYAIGTTIAKIYDPIERKIHKITVGIPLPDTEVCILDENLKHVPVSAKGEMLIGGLGLAHGYLNNQSLTQQKFIWVTLPEKPPLRLYKTGDFGRFLPDGNIEFLGRMDHQVKIRGHRIELGEIEHAICQHPEIDEAVVIAKGNDAYNKRLFAYFSTLSGMRISQALRKHLVMVLPKHMVPSVFTQLEQFPRTPNGKIDREALIEIKEQEASQKEIIQPKSELEQSLFDIWKEVLNTDSFGIHDNFFESGGDSLQIVCIQTLIEKNLNRNLPITDLFSYPTIAQLAQHLCNLTQKQTFASADPLKQQSVSDKKKAAFQRFKKHHSVFEASIEH
jgi:amino acid adenylation domain-containing protein